MRPFKGASLPLSLPCQLLRKKDCSNLSVSLRLARPVRVSPYLVRAAEARCGCVSSPDRLGLTVTMLNLDVLELK